MIAGNTGAGVYHDWPLERVLIDIKSIPDLAKIEYSKVCKAHMTSAVLLCDPIHADSNKAELYSELLLDNDPH